MKRSAGFAAGVRTIYNERLISFKRSGKPERLKLIRII